MAKDPELQALEEQYAKLMAERDALRAQLQQTSDVNRLKRIPDYKGRAMLEVAPKGKRPFNMSVDRFKTLILHSDEWFSLYSAL